jgi:hypothetical protein
VLRRRSRHRHPDPARLSAARAALLVLATCAIATGCGGADHGVEVDPALLAPSRAGYISRADGLCGFYQDRTERQGREALGLSARDFRLLDSGRIVFRPGRRPSDAAIAAFVADVAVPNLSAQLAELRALQPPRGEQSRLTEIYDTLEAATAKLAADPRRALQPAAMAALFAPPLKLARGYGFRICGARPPSVPAG